MMASSLLRVVVAGSDMFFSKPPKRDPKLFLKKNEVSVDQNEFGILVETFIRDCLHRNNDEQWLDKHIRAWWPKVEEYYRRSIICNIEVQLHVDGCYPHSKHLDNKEMWAKIVKDLRDPRSEFTVKYQCSKCKAENVKLWRDYQTCADYVELECATCLAPSIKLNDKGKHESEHGPTDQVNGKVPAVPVGDSYWGYSSVPSQDLEWWVALPTYPK
jgi:hypothetical protein